MGRKNDLIVKLMIKNENLKKETDELRRANLGNALVTDRSTVPMNELESYVNRLESAVGELIQYAPPAVVGEYSKIFSWIS